MRQERRLIEHAIASTTAGMAVIAKDYAWWDDAVAHAVLALDSDWIDDNPGIYISRTFNYQYSFIIDGANQTLYGAVDGERVAAGAFELLSDGLRQLVAQARQGSGAEPVPATGLLSDAERCGGGRRQRHRAGARLRIDRAARPAQRAGAREAARCELPADHRGRLRHRGPAAAARGRYRGARVLRADGRRRRASRLPQLAAGPPGAGAARGGHAVAGRRPARVRGVCRRGDAFRPARRRDDPVQRDPLSRHRRGELGLDLGDRSRAPDRIRLRALRGGDRGRPRGRARPQPARTAAPGRGARAVGAASGGSGAAAVVPGPPLPTRRPASRTADAASGRQADLRSARQLPGLSRHRDRHHRHARGPGRGLACDPARSADRPAQPAAAARAHRAGPGGTPAPWDAGHGAVSRSRPLQGGQRRLRPRGRRPAARRLRRAARRPSPRDRPRGAARRRRVRDPAGRRGRHRRGAAAGRAAARTRSPARSCSTATRWS